MSLLFIFMVVYAIFVVISVISLVIPVISVISVNRHTGFDLVLICLCFKDPHCFILCFKNSF